MSTSNFPVTFFWSDISIILETTTAEVKFEYNKGLATRLLGKVLVTQDHLWAQCFGFGQKTTKKTPQVLPWVLHK